MVSSGYSDITVVPLIISVVVLGVIVLVAVFVVVVAYRVPG